MPIITLSDNGLQTQSWQWHMRHAVRTVSQLSEILGVSLPHVATDFPLLIPLPYIERMRRGDPHDPLLKQVLPVPEENETVDGYVSDPLQEMSYRGKARGVIQKYDSRALVVTTGACAVNCRYCFRRHFPYHQHQAGHSDWEAIVEAVSANPSLTEVILSGGDPLVLDDDRLARLTASLDRIPHVETIRLHTRLPVVIPQRICDSFIEWVGALQSKVVMVFHANHAREIDRTLTAALGRLNETGATLLNQSVLLRGINDDAAKLVDLSSQLFRAGVLPYYLHLLDPVAGASHFDVSEDKAKHLIREVGNTLPGYLVPRLVREVPGEKSKQPIPLI